MARGGKREGSGRPKGGKNKSTLERKAKLAASGLSPLDFMLKIMRDENEPLDVRRDMAKAAAPYVHPKFSTVEHKGDPNNPIQHSVGFRWMTEKEAAARGWK